MYSDGIKGRSGLLLLSLMLLWGCPASTPEPDADGDADGDGDGDIEEPCGCAPERWDCCCSDEVCDDHVFCNGTETCDRGLCEADRNATLDPRTGQYRLNCDDGFSCTFDECDEEQNLCSHEPRHDECLDDDDCDGVERCMPGVPDADEAGCVDGAPMLCDDGDPCTDDRCEANTCLVSLRDRDEDGYSDAACTLCAEDDPRDCQHGDDCDDGDPEVFPGAAEVCDDGRDNNCDRLRDYADPSCDIPNDACAEAMPLTPSVVINSSTRGALADIDSGCSAPDDPDVVFAFNITEAQDVEIDVEAVGARNLTVALTSDCGNPLSDVKCTTGRAFTQISRALPPGTYYVVVSAGGMADFTIELGLSDPVERPEGDQCSSAVDVSSGGTFSGTTIGFDADYDVTCSPGTDRDATFVVTVEETVALDLSVDAPGDVSVAVQETCGVPSTELGCFARSPVAGRVGSLSPGTYYILVKSAEELDFTLTVDFAITSADSCEHLRDASSGGAFYGTTAGLGADIDTACGDPGDPDSAYTFTLTEARDVTVDFTSLGASQTLSLTTACDDPAAEIRCASGREFQLRGRGLDPGVYYLVTTGTGGGDPFELDLNITAPVARPDDDLCTGAIAIAGSGSFSGDTFDCENDYESRCGASSDLDSAFVFTLTEPRSLELAVTGGSGPVSVAIQPDCGVLGTERSCFTTEGSTTRYYRSLDAGTWYLVFKTPGPDTFDFDMTFGEPEETTLVPWLDTTGHGTATLFGWEDDGQYNVDISPLTFPFNGEDQGCLAVSTNGYVRFGPPGGCPEASGYSDEETDIDQVFLGTAWAPPRAQVSWLGADGYAGTDVRAYVDTALNRVVITYLGHHNLGAMGTNDVQLVFFCDSGDIQISYGAASTFDTGGFDHWAIGLSEPSTGTLQSHDFPAHDPGTSVSFGPGAISQLPAHTSALSYAPLAGRAVYFIRSGSSWDVIVDDQPL